MVSVTPVVASGSALGGNTVTAILGTHDCGVVAPAVALVPGVVVEFLDTQVGLWQYSVDAGANWQPVRTDLINREDGPGLVLDAQARLRVLPLSGSRTSARVVYHRLERPAGERNGNYQLYPPPGDGDRPPSVTVVLGLADINGAPPPTQASRPRNKMVRAPRGAPRPAAQAGEPQR
ncbi:hypothetical protein [Xylophilus sp.]|uniref:hypothetical protein n=1 Tax=Xylophilus sp. TaxID=2653893 RepID=UPI0013BACC92|nr:hypothetical protein [Xylophilus sp.]KAF1043245.1 MAG: hypothetical protein GAK38_04044 [Xylophilus sp.]